MTHSASQRVGMIAVAFASAVIGAGAVLAVGFGSAAAGPIYGPREIADMELAVIEASTTSSYWTLQEDKASNMVQLLASQPVQSPRDSIMMNLATGHLHRASSARIEAGLVLERTKARLDGMRQINEPLTAQVVR